MREWLLSATYALLLDMRTLPVSCAVAILIEWVGTVGDERVKRRHVQSRDALGGSGRLKGMSVMWRIRVEMVGGWGVGRTPCINFLHSSVLK